MGDAYTIACISSATAFALVLTATRISIRKIERQLFTWDDWISLIAAPLYAFHTVCYVFIVLKGTNLVYDGAPLEPGEYDGAVLGSIFAFADRPVYLTYIWMMKLCLLVYFTRLRPQEINLVLIEWTGVLLIPTWIGCMFAYFLSCLPFSNNFKIDIGLSLACTTGLSSVLTLVSMNVVTNLIIMLLPLPIIIRQKKTRRFVYQTLAMYFMGLLVTGLILLQLLVVVQNSPGTDKSIWQQLEAFLITILVNVPVIRELYLSRQPLSQDSDDEEEESLFEHPITPPARRTQMTQNPPPVAPPKSPRPSTFDSSPQAASLRSFSQIPIPSVSQANLSRPNFQAAAQLLTALQSNMSQEWMFLHPPSVSAQNLAVPTPIIPIRSKSPSLSLRRMPSLSRRQPSPYPGPNESLTKLALPIAISRTIEVSQERHRVESDVGDVLEGHGDVHGGVDAGSLGEVKTVIRGRVSPQPWRLGRRESFRGRADLGSASGSGSGETSPRMREG